MSASTILMIVGVIIIFVCVVMMILNIRQKTNADSFQKGFNKHLLLTIPFAFGGLCLFVGAILALSNLAERL